MRSILHCVCGLLERIAEVSHLQEADSHKEKAVGADPSSENLIQIPLEQELLQHQNQLRKHWVFLMDKRNPWLWL